MQRRTGTLVLLVAVAAHNICVTQNEECLQLLSELGDLQTAQALDPTFWLPTLPAQHVECTVKAYNRSLNSDYFMRERSGLITTPMECVPCVFDAIVCVYPLDMDNTVSLNVLHNGYYDRDVMALFDFVLSFAEGPQLVYDVGANVGYMTQYLASKGHYVRAFEPIRAHYEKIIVGLWLNNYLDLVKVYPWGASDTDAYFLPSYTDLKNRGHTMVYTPHRGSPASKGNETISLHRLDRFALAGPDSGDFGDNPFLVKLDVEGHERELLRGMAGLFHSHLVPFIVFEYAPTCLREAGMVPENLLRFLLSCGYSLLCQYGQTLDVLGWSAVEHYTFNVGKGMVNLLANRTAASATPCDYGWLR